MARRLILAVSLLAITCLFSLIPLANGQAVYGSIYGTVTDPQGAAVAGAKVTVTSVRKGTADEATTNPSGNFNVTHLIPRRL